MSDLPINPADSVPVDFTPAESVEPDSAPAGIPEPVLSYLIDFQEPGEVSRQWLQALRTAPPEELTPRLNEVEAWAKSWQAYLENAEVLKLALEEVKRRYEGSLQAIKLHWQSLQVIGDVARLHKASFAVAGAAGGRGNKGNLLGKSEAAFRSKTGFKKWKLNLCINLSKYPKLIETTINEARDKGVLPSYREFILAVGTKGEDEPPSVRQPKVFINIRIAKNNLIRFIDYLAKGGVTEKLTYPDLWEDIRKNLRDANEVFKRIEEEAYRSKKEAAIRILEELDDDDEEPDDGDEQEERDE